MWRILTVASPSRVRISELVTKVARATGSDLNVVAGWPRWALAALRAIGRRPFELPAHLRGEVPNDDLSSIHPGPWRTVEEVARATAAASAASRRNDDHATLGV